MFDQIKGFINPSKNPDLTHAHEFQRQHLPTLWLLGKTGAGKSSFIQAITGLSSVEVGNGFAPCTMTSKSYQFPQDKPVMRFLDTRGVGESDYDPALDIAEIEKSAHALVVVMRVDDPEQSSLLLALKTIKKNMNHLLVIHSGVLLCNEQDRARQITFNNHQIQQVWGKNFDSIGVDFEAPNGTVYQYEQLIEKLSVILPVVGMMVADKEHETVEQANYDQVEKEVLWYAGSASASDLVPAVGLVSVPAIQAKMLHSLANQYDVEWNKRTFSELIGTLGGSFALQYGVKLGARQLIKLIPVYGQTVGSVAAAAVSFATTYGLGRAACFYFYHKSKGEDVSNEAMQTIYKNALKKGKAASGYEKD